jgi:hypothetical protein
VTAKTPLIPKDHLTRAAILGLGAGGHQADRAEQQSEL